MEKESLGKRECFAQKEEEAIVQRADCLNNQLREEHLGPIDADRIDSWCESLYSQDIMEADRACWPELDMA